MSRVALQIENATPELRAAITQAEWKSLAGIEISDVAEANFVLSTDPAAALATREIKPVLLTTQTWSQGLGEVAGVALKGHAPKHEVRTRQAFDRFAAISHTDPDVVGYLTDSPALLVPEADDVLACYSFAIGLESYPVFTFRPSTGVGLSALGNDPSIWQDGNFLRLVHRFMHQIGGRGAHKPIKVGLLGFGAIGNEHSSRIASVEGMSVAAICDSSADRLASASASNPDANTTQDADELLASDVDLVIVSTPPNSHANWGLRALRAGKHVVLEKPMALTTTECDEMLALATEAGLLLSVYQNRRWDPDYQIIEENVKAGRIGEVFRIETFVGGYSHPCNFWHSDQEVSGGAIFDWGSHLIDQIMQLAPGPVVSVNATNLKRVWHDVTNADHSIVNLTFADGSTAEFTHSDIAAALKPRWYILGTKGALVGDWRRERVISRSEIGTLLEDLLAPADSPAQVQLHHPDGSVSSLAPTRHTGNPAGAYHQEVADYLWLGLPMSIDARHSRDVIAIMQAAEESAKAGGITIIPDL